MNFSKFNIAFVCNGVIYESHKMDETREVRKSDQNAYHQK